MVIYGWKTYVQVLAVLQLVCGQCGNNAEHVVRKLTTKFTLFWIPLFPINRKHTQTCSACGHVEKIPGVHADQLVANGGTTGPGMPAPGMQTATMSGPNAPCVAPQRHARAVRRPSPGGRRWPAHGAPCGSRRQ